MRAGAQRRNTVAAVGLQIGCAVETGEVGGPCGGHRGPLVRAPRSHLDQRASLGGADHARRGRRDRGVVVEDRQRQRLQQDALGEAARAPRARASSGSTARPRRSRRRRRRTGSPGGNPGSARRGIRSVIQAPRRRTGTGATLPGSVPSPRPRRSGVRRAAAGRTVRRWCAGARSRRAERLQHRQFVLVGQQRDGHRHTVAGDDAGEGRAGEEPANWIESGDDAGEGRAGEEPANGSSR